MWQQDKNNVVYYYTAGPPTDRISTRITTEQMVRYEITYDCNTKETNQYNMWLN